VYMNNGNNKTVALKWKIYTTSSGFLNLWHNYTILG